MNKLKKHIKTMIERLKELINITDNENNKNYLQGKMDAYEDILICFIEGSEHESI